LSTYSYGRSGTRHHSPANDLELAHYQAQRASALGESWAVHEYPPGDPQPGKLIATYLNGEIAQGSGPDA
jgi:hypothetical protein